MLPNTVGTAVDGGMDRAARLNLAQDFRFRGRSGLDDSADKEVIFDPIRNYDLNHDEPASRQNQTC